MNTMADYLKDMTLEEAKANYLWKLIVLKKLVDPTTHRTQMTFLINRLELMVDYPEGMQKLPERLAATWSFDLAELNAVMTYKVKDTYDRSGELNMKAFAGR